jgi:Recombination endonuclease VII
MRHFLPLDILGSAPSLACDAVQQHAGAWAVEMPLALHEETTLYQGHSYRSGKMRGGLCRQCNCTVGMLKDSPTRLRKALTYLRNPPAKALGFGETEQEKAS